jgi:hypothetical protein
VWGSGICFVNRLAFHHLALLGNDARTKVSGRISVWRQRVCVCVVGDLAEPVASSSGHDKSGSRFHVLEESGPEVRRRREV